MPSCCLDKYDCHDGNPCTTDYCVFDRCFNWVLAKDAGCCSKENEALDCYYQSVDGFEGKCMVQPDWSKKCAKVPSG